MTDSIKRKIILYLALAGTVTILLGSSLSQLRLQPGMPVPPLENGSYVLMPGPLTPLVILKPNIFFLTLFGILLAAVLIYSVVRVLKGIHWLKVIKHFFAYLFVMVVVVGLLALISSSLPATQEITPIQEIPTASEVVGTAPLGSPPALLIWLVIIGILMVAGLLAYWYFGPKPKPVDRFLLLETEAEKARRALLSGSSLKEIILQCYRRMSEVLQEERGIEREISMTTGEFERLLEEKGYPYDPVHQLTRLFDAVRYGDWQPDASDKQNAIDSLDAIIAFSRAQELAG